MSLIRIIYKLLSLSFLAVIAVPVVVFLSFGSDQTSPNDKLKSFRKKWLQNVVNVVGIEVELRGKTKQELSASKQSALWTANHISWMDIAVIGSQGVGFLSKSEIRSWPVIGWLGEKGGTVFIQRGGKNASQMAAKAIAEKINGGDSILVFPEGTTSSGDNIKRFHARIFAPALDHNLKVQPIAVQYLDDQGNIHPKASWNEQSFMANLIGILAQPKIHAILTFLPLIDAQQFSERRRIAQAVEDQIRTIVLTNN